MSNIKWYLVCVMVVLSACSNTQHQAEKLVGGEGISIIHTPSDVQTSYVKSPDSRARFCTETDVDFSKTASSGLSLGLGRESVGEESSQGALALGGRDPAVLMARELMFRACEFTLNANADPRLALKVYAGTLDAIVKIAKYQQSDGSATATAAASIDMSSVRAQPTIHEEHTHSDFSGTRHAGEDAAPKEVKTQSAQASNDDKSYDWDFNWDYKDEADTIDPAHP